MVFVLSAVIVGHNKRKGLLLLQHTEPKPAISPSGPGSSPKDGASFYTEVISKQQSDLKTLRSDFDLLSSELQLRTELSSEMKVQVHDLEKKAHAAEEQAQSVAQQLSNALEEKKSLSNQVEG